MCFELMSYSSVLSAWFHLYDAHPKRWPSVDCPWLCTWCSAAKCRVIQHTSSPIMHPYNTLYSYIHFTAKFLICIHREIQSNMQSAMCACTFMSNCGHMVARRPWGFYLPHLFTGPYKTGVPTPLWLEPYLI